MSLHLELQEFEILSKRVYLAILATCSLGSLSLMFASLPSVLPD